MKSYSLSHLSDQTLLRGLASLVARDRSTTADLLAHIAEVDARKLYAPAGYPSMYAYCIHHLHLAEDAACRRIRAARVARKFPAIFPAVADGRLHVSAVLLLEHHLNPENADGLVTAAAHKTKSQIEHLLANRFPQPDVPTVLQPVPAPARANLGGTLVGSERPDTPSEPAPQDLEPGVATATSQDSSPAPARVDAPARLKPLAPQRFSLQLTMGQEMRDKLELAQQLLGHRVKSADIAAVLERALDSLIHELQKRKFAATDRPRPTAGTNSGRHVPAPVRREVWKRDGGRCTFVGDSGRRCQERHALEFDHVQEFARGGPSTVANLRLRCRTHNQYAAEQSFGAGFMQLKRLDARASRDVRTAAARAL
ncbi:MAG TPA: hypothetical protein VFQ05_00925 [Candidatus Eisenbacteria bacterium]|nr:hypothetical protein [Candidatus Eisenbacteria bacterium]